MVAPYRTFPYRLNKKTHLRIMCDTYAFIHLFMHLFVNLCIAFFVYPFIFYTVFFTLISQLILALRRFKFNLITTHHRAMQGFHAIILRGQLLLITAYK